MSVRASLKGVRGWQSGVRLFACACLGLSSARVAGADTVTFGLAELAQMARSIVQGTVSAVEGEEVAVRVHKIIKGTVTPGPVRVHVDARRSHEDVPLAAGPGDEVVLFLGPETAPVKPVAGARGVVKIDPASAASEIRTIELITAIGQAQDPKLKQTALKEMLQMGFTPATEEALGIVYGQWRSLDPTELISPVIAVARKGEKRVRATAVEVLGRIGDKSTVLTLVDLLEDPDIDVSLTAFRILKKWKWTRAEIDFDPAARLEIRKSAAGDWRRWWQANKDKIVLQK
jgi:hypothetical protein